MYVKIGAAHAALWHLDRPLQGCRPDTVPAGGRPMVIAAHAASPSLGIWDKLRQVLVSDCDFVVHSVSDTDAAPAQDLVDLIHELGAGPVDLLGWDAGSRTVLQTALAHPELVRSITLYDPCIGEVLNHIDGGDAVETDFLWEVFKVVPLPDDMPSCPPAPMPFPAVDARSVAKVTVPALVMTGELSHPRYQIIAEWLAAHLPTGKERVWPGLGHRCLLESSDVASETTAFLSAI